MTPTRRPSPALPDFFPFLSGWMIIAAMMLAMMFLRPLVMHPGYIPMPPVVQNSDLLISHLPNAQYLHRALFEYGQIPLWNAQMFAGQPFAADPLAGMSYLPNWLTAFFPRPAAFNLLFLFHLAWAGLGLFVFLRSEGRSPLAAAIGAVAFMGTPKLLGHVAGGHVSLVFAVCWTPWLLLLVKRAFPAGNWRQGALAGACLGVMIGIDIRWGFYAGLLAATYGVWRLAPGYRFAVSPHTFRRNMGTGVACGLFAVILSAGLTVPLLEFMELSRRSGLSAGEAAIFSFSWGDVLGLVLPKVGVYYELIVYVGTAPLVLAAIGLRRGNGFWALTAGAAGLFALGPNTPFYPLLVRVVPLFDWLRVPSRVWFVGALAVAVLASSGADRLLWAEFPATLRRWLLPCGAAFSLAAGLLGGSAAVLAKPALPGWVALGIFMPLSLGITALIWGGKLTPRAGVGALAVVLLIDLLWAGTHQLSAVPLPSTGLIEDRLSERWGEFRVYSPSDGVAFTSGLEFVNGVNPLHLASTARFLGEAAGYATGHIRSASRISILMRTPRRKSVALRPGRMRSYWGC